MAEVPKISEIEGDRARFDAAKLTTRQINLELRWLLSEDGSERYHGAQPGGQALDRGGDSPALQDHASKGAWAISAAG